MVLLDFQNLAQYRKSL